MSFQFKVAENNKGLIPYVNTYGVVFTQSSIPAQCNTMMFINQGTSVAIINGVLELAPQQSHTMDGNFREWDNTNYVITFNQDSGNINKLVTVRKVYQQIS